MHRPLSRRPCRPAAAALPVLLLLAACGSASATPAPASPAATPTATAAVSLPAGAVPVTLADFMISAPATIAAGHVTFAVHNDGPTPHQFTLRDGGGRAVAATAVLDPQASARLDVTLTAGHYTYLCALPGHASLGMQGELTVTPS